jgi:hypothetical protein
MLKRLLLTALFLFFAQTTFAQAITCLPLVNNVPTPQWTPGCVITLQWADNSNNELGFHIWRKLNSALYSTTPSATVGVGVTTFQDAGMVQGAVPNVYTWVVSAFDTGSTGLNQESAVTNEVTFTVPPATILPPIAPTNLTTK